MKLASAFALASAIALSSTNAAAQSAKALVGSWTLVSAGETWGKDPKGKLIFGSSGHYTLVITRTGLPKFASNSRVKGTADENKSVVAGSVAHFGRYSVDEKDKAIVLNIESSTFPNWVGTTQKRIFEIKGGQLRYTNPKPSAGGAPTARVVWNRAK